MKRAKSLLQAFKRRKITLGPPVRPEAAEKFHCVTQLFDPNAQSVDLRRIEFANLPAELSCLVVKFLHNFGSEARGRAGKNVQFPLSPLWQRPTRTELAVSPRCELQQDLRVLRVSEGRMSAFVPFSTLNSRNSDQMFRRPLPSQSDRHARNRFFYQNIPVACRAQLLCERLQLDREPKSIVFGHRPVKDRESSTHTADGNSKLMCAFRIIVLVGEIGAGQHMSNARLGNRGKTFSHAHGGIDEDRPRLWGGEFGMLDEIIAAGLLTLGFDPQRNNSVETMREFVNAWRLSRFQLKLNFGDRRFFSFRSNYAAIDCAFDLGLSELQKPGFSFNIRRKNTCEVMAGTTLPNHPADIWICDLRQVGPVAADRALKLGTLEKACGSCVHFYALQ
ncbi:MAG TPA: hypothetical protein VN154_13040, partial [Rhizomicrobium sp.]|nr:hypothetical protein [Rhizomicrobium sp.]